VVQKILLHYFSLELAARAVFGAPQLSSAVRQTGNMTTEQLEAWALAIIDRLMARLVVEDSRVELKADWPEPRTAARRIAGHANAAETNSILWLVGLDEQKGIVPITSIDQAQWFAQVFAEFDGIHLSPQDLVVPTPSGPVVAILFDVSRRPFVLKNSVFGQTGGGSVSLEVPWRSGTAVRTARRDELLRILVPRQALPSVELLEASAEVNIHGPMDGSYGERPTDVQRSEHLAWSFSLTLYVTPHNQDLLVLPTHKAVFSFALASDKLQVAHQFRFFAPYRMISIGESRLDSSTVTASAGEAVFRGPGLVHARGSHYEAVRTLPSDAGLAAKLELAPAGSDLTTELTFRLVCSGGSSGHKRSWKKE